MTSEAIPVNGSEVVVLQASEGIRFVIEEVAEDRITVRFAAKGNPGSAERGSLLACGASEEVVHFAEQLGIVSPLVTAMRIAHDCFPTAEKWALFAHRVEPLQVEINVTVKGTVDAVYAMHSDCARRWALSLPPEALGKIALTEDFA